MKLILAQFVGHKGNFRIFTNTNSFNCFSKEKGGKILKYLIYAEGLTDKEAVEKLYKITNTTRDFDYNYKKVKTITTQKETSPKVTQEELDKINNFVMQNYNKQTDADKEKISDYLVTRYIDKEAINKYHLFISKDIKGIERLYIPILEQGKAIAYIGRAMSQKAQQRYNNSRGTIMPFNLDYIKKQAETEQEKIYICEGCFDAMSIEQVGYKAISLNSTNNIDKFIEVVKNHIETAKTYKYIISTDTDKARTRSKGKIAKRVESNRYKKC